MPRIIRAHAFANNEVAYIAWEIDDTKIQNCLGFHIVREYLDANDKVLSERPLAAYVAFKGQSNEDWAPQNTTVWPIQKFNWRDLTLRRKRNEANLRPANERVRYRIRAVARFVEGLEAVITIPESHWDKESNTTVQHVYKGKPIPLGYLTEPIHTNAIDVTTNRPPFVSSFTNGILSTQFLVRVLERDGKIEDGELMNHLKTPHDWLRNYLSGDVITVIQDFFTKRQNGRFYAALYELEDEELVDLLCQNADRLDLILADAGSVTGKLDSKGKRKKIYDTRNSAARTKLRTLASNGGTGFNLQDRMFNGSGHIGHNKFIVYVDEQNKARAVLTGSTNWTWSGVAGQSNNCICIEDDNVARDFLVYWERIKADKQKVPKPISARAVGANQSDDFKEKSRTHFELPLSGDAKLELWCSPNVPGKAQPPGKKVKNSPPPPPDMDRLFSLMRKAERAIFFLVFMPARGGINSIVSEAIQLGLKDTSLEVIGAISSSQAMWGYEPATKTNTGETLPAWSPHTFQKQGVSVVRASALTDRKIARELGDFKFSEVLTTGIAIIHDKILVIDPHDPKKCVVAFGSHNMGYKASYSNDENLIIVHGHQALARAYAAHVLDVYDHYRFRAIVAQNTKKMSLKERKEDAKRHGFLDNTEVWQDRVSRRLSRYFTA